MDEENKSVEYGRIEKADKVDIVVTRDKYKGKEAVSIREYVKSAKYTGFTKSGTRIPMEKWKTFKAIVNKID